MIKFDGLVIVAEPDYKERIAKGIEIEEISCKAYDEEDKSFRHSLLEFTLLPERDFDDETESDIEKAIKRTVSMDWATIQLERANVKLERTREILNNAFGYLSNIQKGEELYDTLKNHLKMSDEEIKSADFDGIDELLSENNGVEMNLS